MKKCKCVNCGCDIQAEEDQFLLCQICANMICGRDDPSINDPFAAWLVHGYFRLKGNTNEWIMQNVYGKSLEEMVSDIRPINLKDVKIEGVQAPTGERMIFNDALYKLVEKHENATVYVYEDINTHEVQVLWEMQSDPKPCTESYVYDVEAHERMAGTLEFGKYYEIEEDGNESENEN